MYCEGSGSNRVAGLSGGALSPHGGRWAYCQSGKPGYLSFEARGSLARQNPVAAGLTCKLGESGLRAYRLHIAVPRVSLAVPERQIVALPLWDAQSPI